MCSRRHDGCSRKHQLENDTTVFSSVVRVGLPVREPRTAAIRLVWFPASSEDYNDTFLSPELLLAGDDDDDGHSSLKIANHGSDTSVRRQSTFEFWGFLSMAALMICEVAKGYHFLC